MPQEVSLDKVAGKPADENAVGRGFDDTFVHHLSYEGVVRLGAFDALLFERAVVYQMEIGAAQVQEVGARRMGGGCLEVCCRARFGLRFLHFCDL